MSDFSCFTPLEISLGAIPRGFESLPLRQKDQSTSGVAPFVGFSFLSGLPQFDRQFFPKTSMKAVIRTHYVAAYWLRGLQYACGVTWTLLYISKSWNNSSVMKTRPRELSVLVVVVLTVVEAVMESSWLGRRFLVSQIRNDRFSISASSQCRPPSSSRRSPVNISNAIPNATGSGARRAAVISRRCSSRLNTCISVCLSSLW